MSLLRQIEVVMANGKTTPAACRESGITEQTYYRSRKEYDGLQVDQTRRRCAVAHAREHGLSEPRACRLANQPRGTQRCQPTQRDDEDALTRATIVLASEYGRYGYGELPFYTQSFA